MKTALITGANKGIGFASAKLFLENGYNVILSGRNGEKLEEARKKLGFENCRYVIWDVSDVGAGKQAIEQAHGFFGDIDVFVNNAGFLAYEDLKGYDFLDKTEKMWDETMNVNLKGVFFAMQHEVRYMRERGICGNIVNICSEMGFRAARNAYGISKWGVRGMTKGIAKDMAKYGIVINAVAPGETATEILGQKDGETRNIPSPRGVQATPFEIAQSVFFLANSRNIIGEILVSDGGRRLY